MQRIIDTISSLVLMPLVLFLGFIGFIMLFGNVGLAIIHIILVILIAVTSPSRKRRPRERRRGQSTIKGAYSGSDIIHLSLVTLAVCYSVGMVESQDTDTGYYRKVYWWFAGIPFVYVAPILHARLAKKVAEQGAASDR